MTHLDDDQMASDFGHGTQTRDFRWRHAICAHRTSRCLKVLELPGDTQSSLSLNALLVQPRERGRGVVTYMMLCLHALPIWRARTLYIFLLVLWCTESMLTTSPTSFWEMARLPAFELFVHLAVSAVYHDVTSSKVACDRSSWRLQSN